MWVLCNNSAFDLEYRKTTKKEIDLTGRFQNLSDAYYILEKGPAFKLKKKKTLALSCGVEQRIQRGIRST